MRAESTFLSSTIRIANRIEVAIRVDSLLMVLGKQ